MKTKEELAKQKSEWFQKNKKEIYERRRAYFKKWRKKNREKWNAYGRRWIANNKERHAESNALWQKRNPAKRRKYIRKYKRIHKQQIAERQRIRLLGYKQRVVEAYGGGCLCCGEKSIAFLTVEHIKRNGKTHRRKVGGNFYYYLVRNNFPKEHLSILCMNCNWAQRNGWPCPHKM